MSLSAPSKRMKTLKTKRIVYNVYKWTYHNWMSIWVIPINLIIEKQIVCTNASEKRTQENCSEIFHLWVLICKSLLRNCGLLILRVIFYRLYVLSVKLIFHASWINNLDSPVKMFIQSFSLVPFQDFFFWKQNFCLIQNNCFVLFKPEIAHLFSIEWIWKYWQEWLCLAPPSTQCRFRH